MKLTICPTRKLSAFPYCALVPTVCIKHLKPALPENALLEIIFLNTREIHKLNRKFRGQDKPTDVLSFIGDGETYIGSIALCEKIIAKYNPNTKFRHALYKTIIHGTLHLLGYDHENDDEAEEMEKLEHEVWELVTPILIPS